MKVWFAIATIVFCVQGQAFAATKPVFSVVLMEEGQISKEPKYKPAQQVAEAALAEAGCTMGDGEGSRAISIRAVIIKTDSDPICSFKMKAQEPNGDAFYRGGHKNVSDFHCTPEWLNEQVRDHVKEACTKAVLIAAVEANRQANQKLGSPTQSAPAVKPLFRVAVEPRHNTYLFAAKAAEGALSEAGCAVGSGEGARTINIAAQFHPENPLPRCVLSMNVFDLNGAVFYTGGRHENIDDVNCSWEWLNEQVRDHVKEACTKAVLIAEVEANQKTDQAVATHNAAFEVSERSAPPITTAESSLTRWVLPSLLIASGVGAMGWGGYLLSKDGDSADCGPNRCWSRYDNGSKGALFLGVGGAAAAVGGWWLWHSHREPSQTSFMVGPGSVALKGSF